MEECLNIRGYKSFKFEDLQGNIFTSIIRTDDAQQLSGQYNNSDQILFTDSSGCRYLMLYFEDCCAGVGIEDITGDLNDLLDSPILLAEEVCEDAEDGAESSAWTFYKLVTNKGSVTIRWYGSSNGYYSETASFIKLDELK
jgi:hypothetical protein